MGGDKFAAALPRIDLSTAASNLTRNDLLPPRLDDKVGGEVGKRFTESLANEMATGGYAPRRSIAVQVPKSGLTTRPAALLSLRDRVVYHALVASLTPRIETYLVSPDVAFWPRGKPAAKRWREFDDAPAQVEATHVVLMDVSAFYESINHTILTATLIEATGRSDAVDALGDFLQAVMGTDRGLPQGLDASDPLATAFLASVDRAALREGLDYFRNGDDMRVAVRSYNDGVRAIAHIERELRRIQLSLNGEKCIIVKAETYRGQLDHVAEAKSALRQRLEQRRLEALIAGDPEVVERAAVLLDLPPEYFDGNLEEDELAQLLSDLDAPYHRLTIEERIEIAGVDLTPDDVEVACTLFRETVGDESGSERPALSKEEFHERLQDALLILTAKKDPCALSACARLLIDYPSETALLATYLGALVDESPDEVTGQIIQVITAPTFRHAWQVAWLTRPLLKMPARIPAEVIDAERPWLRSDDAGWLRRTALAQLLAATDQLNRDDLVFLWRAAPQACQPDLLHAAWIAADHGSEWASRFLHGCMGDRVNEVVIQHLGGIPHTTHESS